MRRPGRELTVMHEAFTVARASLARTRAALKQVGGTALRMTAAALGGLRGLGGSLSSWGRGFLGVPGWSDPGGPNSAVAACVNWITRTFPEAPVRVRRLDEAGVLQAAPLHPLTRLIRRPNPFWTEVRLWQATLADFYAHGNAYWWKRRSATGRVVELWWLPSWTVEVAFEPDSGEYLDGYWYAPFGPRMRLAADDVVHFPFGADPLNPRRGLSPLLALLREIGSDDEAANFAGALLKNLGIPGVVIAPDSAEAQVDQSTAEEFKARFADTFSGPNRGKPLVMPTKTTVQVLSFSPEQMNLTSLRRLPEERISAVLGVPAIVAGLGAGLDRATYSNMAEAREHGYEGLITALYRVFSTELEAQLLPDLGDPNTETVDFDISQVRILQEDINAAWTRYGQAVKDGLLMVSEARAALGYPTTPDHDVYLLPTSTLPTARLGGEGASEAAREAAAARVLPPPARNGHVKAEVSA